MDNIEDLMKSGHFDSRTQTIQFLIRVGFRINEFKVKCEDPDFVKELNKDWEIEEAADWLDKLSYSQKEIIGKAWEIAKRKRERELDRMIR